MHIGVVTQSYYPVLGGVTEHAYHLSRELVRRGHRITILTGKGSVDEDRGLRVLRLGRWMPLTMNGATIHVALGFRFGKTLQAIQAQERFDVVHIHAPLDPFLPLAATENLQKPLVGTFHTYRSTNPFAALFPEKYKRALFRLNLRIAVSESAKAYVTRYVDAPFEIIPNGVDTERFSPVQEPFPQFRDGAFTILFVGRIDPRKGARVLFQALPYLERELQDYRVLVVGGGWRRKVYQQFIPLGLERRVHFAGYASWEDLPRYYRSADVYCSPALGGESFGIVLLEAMASQVAIVASDIQGYRQVMKDGRQGLFARPQDPQSLAEKIVALERNAKARREMAERGRETALEYDWKVIADQVLKVYERIV